MGGGFGVPNPPLIGGFGLFCIPVGDVPKPFPAPLWCRSACSHSVLSKSLQLRLVGRRDQASLILRRIVNKLPLFIFVLVIELADCLILAKAGNSNDRGADDLARAERITAGVTVRGTALPELPLPFPMHWARSRSGDVCCPDCPEPEACRFWPNDELEFAPKPPLPPKVEGCENPPGDPFSPPLVPMGLAPASPLSES